MLNTEMFSCYDIFEATVAEYHNISGSGHRMTLD